MHAELNRLLVGSGLILLNIELQQDHRTVCCGQNTVQEESCLIQKENIVFYFCFLYLTFCSKELSRNMLPTFILITCVEHIYENSEQNIFIKQFHGMSCHDSSFLYFQYPYDFFNVGVKLFFILHE